MLPLARSVFGVWWTTAITLAGVAAARALHNDAHALTAERIWARGLLRGWGVEITVLGAERLRADTSYVVMPNHRSHVDVPVLFAALPSVPSFMAKRELMRIPVLGAALRAGQHVLVERGDKQSGRRAIDSAAEQVAEGRTVVVFPEGTRSVTGELGELKKGGFLIAKRAGVAIAPVHISGSEKILPPGASFPRPGKVRVHIGEPIGADEVKAMTARALVERLRAALAALAEPVSAEDAAGLQDRTSHVRIASA